jgi:hypothetical protein
MRLGLGILFVLLLLLLLFVFGLLGLSLLQQTKALSQRQDRIYSEILRLSLKDQRYLEGIGEVNQEDPTVIQQNEIIKLTCYWDPNHESILKRSYKPHNIYLDLLQDVRFFI